MSALELDPLLVTTLAELQRHGVQFVVVGDVARAIHDNGGFVSSLAIVPAAYGRNADRLVAALRALDAELGIAGRRPSEPLDWREADLRELSPCSFETSGADVDVDFEPPGTGGYRDLFDEAERIELAPGVAPLVATRADVERVRRGMPAAVRYGGG